MLDIVKVTFTVTPESLEEGYRRGIFPMGHEGERAFTWHEPDPRGIIPLDAVHVPTSLRRRMRRGGYDITVDRAFGEVVRQCAARPGVWLTPKLVAVYEEMHRRGRAHSLEVWVDGELAGGIFGVHVGGAFFAESKFHRVTDMSKVALVTLLGLLREAGFVLFDVQYWTPHLAQFGTVEVPKADYRARLEAALRETREFPGAGRVQARPELRWAKADS
ncbi:MAG: leucyl/phenylalanyl-tRNA--protein transferase [Bryobacteraceae bacterium]|nr:MAG: leucyl/phenylalanyl-tRNA--protein transferase [Bryobacteraceae bacterium]